MKGSPLLRALLGLGFVVLFVFGGYLVYTGLQEQPPEPTPTPDAEYSVNAEDARQLDRDEADRSGIAAACAADGPEFNRASIELPAEGTVTDHLFIPSINVSAPISGYGVNSRNVMQLPTDMRRVARLETSATLGADAGSTVLAGHVTYLGDHGTLYCLGKVQPGATIVTADESGRQTTWVVTSARNYRKQELPEELFATDGERQLALVTCGGEIVPTPSGNWTYEDNIVIVAVPLTAG